MVFYQPGERYQYIANGVTIVVTYDRFDHKSGQHVWLDDSKKRVHVPDVILVPEEIPPTERPKPLGPNDYMGFKNKKDK